MAVCFVVGAGRFTARGLNPKPDDFVIAADAGYLALQKIGILPHLLVGDFDSLHTKPTDVPTLTFPPEKDDTDMGIAMQEGWKRGYRSYVIYGGDGGRIDHYFANLQMMGGYSRKGAQVHMVGEDCDIFAITSTTLVLPERLPKTVVSVFCHGECAQGVTLKGLKYPLLDALLTCDFPLGVSNEYTGAKEASVTVQNGTLLVVVALEPGNNEV